MANLNLMQKLIDILAIRVFEMIRLGEVKLHQGGKTQTWQVEADGEVVENVKHLEQYGITGVAPEGSETLIFNVQGNRTNNIVLNIGNRELRFKELKRGEVAVYDNSGNYIHLKNGGVMDVIAPETINAKAKTVNINGSDQVFISGKNTTIIADTLTVNAKNATITAQTTTVNGKVNLAGGGKAIARFGDTVEVDPLTHKGTITSGSTEVTSA